MNVYFAGTLAMAAWFALMGTNVQARLARRRLLADRDPLIAEAGRLWTPTPRWLSRLSRRRRERALVEAKIRRSASRARRYEDLCDELFAWNALESSVALAFAAAVVGPVVGFLT